MNRGELVTRAGRTMGMARSAADGTEEVAYLQQLAQEAVIDVLSRTRVHVECAKLRLTAGYSEYDLSQQALRIWSMRSEGGTPLAEVSDLDMSAYGDTGAFQFVGHNRIMLSWEPSTGEVLEAWISPLPTMMDSDDDDPALPQFGFIPAQFHDALTNYMCWKAGEATRDQGSQMGEKWRRLYEDEEGLATMGSNLGRIKAAVNRRGSTGAPIARLRRAGLRSPADQGAGTWR